MRGKQAHGMTLVHGQSHVGQVAQDVDDLLANVGGAGGVVQCLEGGADREERLERPDGHHNHHHYRKNRDRVALNEIS